MTTTVQYVGNDDSRVIRSTDFAAAGFGSQATVSWTKTNQFRVDLPDAVALWVLALGSEFATPVAENFAQAVVVAENPFKVKGRLANTGLLPSSGNTLGDVYVINSDGHAHAWNGSAWVDVGEFRGPQGLPGQQGEPGSSVVYGTSAEPNFYDNFTNRAAGQPLDPARWTQLKDLFPNSYDQVGHVSGGVSFTSLRNRPGTYDTAPPSGIPGRLFRGIGGAFRETGSNKVRVGVTWNGDIGEDLTHQEMGCLLHITPSEPGLGVGVWCSSLFGGTPVLYYGLIGNPPENPVVLQSANFTHTDGADRLLEVQSDGLVMRVYLDGVEKTTGWSGTYPLPIPAAYQPSTKHGFALDNHLAAEGTLTSVWTISNCRITSFRDERDFNITGSSGSKVTLGTDGAGGARLALFRNRTDANGYIGFGEALGLPLVGMGPGGATAYDTFISRGGANIVDMGFSGGGTARMARLRLPSVGSLPAGPNVIGDIVVHNGVVKVCTVAGSPGTWTVVGTQT